MRTGGVRKGKTPPQDLEPWGGVPVLVPLPSHLEHFIWSKEGGFHFLLFHGPSSAIILNDYPSHRDPHNTSSRDNTCKTMLAIATALNASGELGEETLLLKKPYIE